MADIIDKYNNFWTNSEYGKELLDIEYNILKSNLHKVFGFHILQIGCPTINYLSDFCKINHQLVLVNNLEYNVQDSRSIIYSADERIPLETASIDAVVIAHDLEFTENPHAVLREIDRILMPEGHLIILNFNPNSFWGIRSILTRKKSLEYPWSGSWRSCYRLCDWLKLLNYDIRKKDFYFYRPCINNKKLLNSMRLFETIGKLIPLGAAGYCISAIKKQEAMISLSANWRRQVELAGVSNYAEPTMRIHDKIDSKN